MQNHNEEEVEDVFTLKRELATLMVQIRAIAEKRNKLLGKTSKRRPKKPVGRNAELWPDQAMMILGVSRRRLAAMLKTGQLADLHPYSIRLALGGYKEPRLHAQWKKKYDWWKLKWSEYEAWKGDQQNKRAENAIKMAEMFISDRENGHTWASI